MNSNQRRWLCCGPRWGNSSIASESTRAGESRAWPSWAGRWDAPSFLLTTCKLTVRPSAWRSASTRRRRSPCSPPHGCGTGAELTSLADQLFSLHWRLRQYSLDGARLDFVDFARRASFGPLAIDGLRICEGDLEIRGAPLFRAPEELWQEAMSIARERQQAANWLEGQDANLFRGHVRYLTTAADVARGAAAHRDGRSSIGGRAATRDPAAVEVTVAEGLADSEPEHVRARRPGVRGAMRWRRPCVAGTSGSSLAISTRRSMIAASYRSPKTEVRASGTHGRGLFAAKAIRQGEIVSVRGGHSSRGGRSGGCASRPATGAIRSPTISCSRRVRSARSTA